jgi:hypothetical protein
MIAFNMSREERTSIPLLLFWLFEFTFMGFVIFSVSIDLDPLYLFDLKGSKYFNQSISICFITHIICAITQLTFNLKTQGNRLKFINYELWNTLFTGYLFIFPLLIISLGGLEFILRKVRFGQSQSDLSRPIIAISEAILYVTAIVLFLTFQQGSEFWKKRHKWKRNFLTLLILILSNPLANARQTTILLLLPLAYPFLTKRIRNRTFVSYGYLLFTFYLPSPIDRYTGKFQGMSFKSPSKMGDFDAFGQLMNTLQHVDLNGLKILEQLLGSALFFVPRTIWSAKPIDSGVLIAKSRNLDFNNLSCPWLAESYLNLGIFGVIVASIAIVLFLAKASSLNQFNYVLSGFLSSVLFIALRGSLLQATGKVFFGLFLIHFLSRKSSSH